MLDYVTEEDVRRINTKGQVQALLTMTNTSMSKWWRGYWQGKHRADEIFFVVPPSVSKAASSPA